MPIYNPLIPQPTDQLSISQGDLLDNFQALQALIDVNHVDFASGDEGKHKWVTFPVQVAAPAFAPGEVGLYNKLPAAPFPLTGVDELFIQKSNGTNIPMTASQQATPGWTYLPSGILLKWGNATALPGSNTFTFPAAATIPAFANIFAFYLTPIGNIGDTFNMYVVSVLAPWTQFTMVSNAAVNKSFTFLALGI